MNIIPISISNRQHFYHFSICWSFDSETNPNYNLILSLKETSRLVHIKCNNFAKEKIFVRFQIPIHSLCSIMVCGQGGHLSPVRLVQSFYSLLLDVSTSSTHCIHFNTNFYTKLFSLLLNVSTCSIRCRACKHCIHSNSNFHTKLQSLSFNVELANIVFIPEICPRHQRRCWCLNFVFCVSWKFCWCQQKEKYHVWLYLHHTFHPLIYIAAWYMN